MLELAHPEADLAVARAAHAEGVAYVFSSQASYPMEQVAAAMNGTPHWFQLYWGTDDGVTRSFVQRAERTGARAIAVTLDTTLLGWRPRDLDLGSLPFLHAKGIAQHLSDPVAAFAEMRRVGKPGGLVAARDADYSAMTWYPASAGLTRWLDLYQEVARSDSGEPDAGRRLRSWALQVGFGEVIASGSVWCFANDDDVAWWSQTWAQRVTGSSFADQATAGGFTDSAELELLAEAWRDWGRVPEAWFVVVHGEVLCTV